MFATPGGQARAHKDKQVRFQNLIFRRGASCMPRMPVSCLSCVYRGEGDMESEGVCICLSAISILGICMRSGRAPLYHVSSQEVAADFLSLNLMSLSSSLGPALPL